MANQNIDIIRVEDTEANLPTTLIPGQLGITNDTNKIGHLMLDGLTMQWFSSDQSTWLYFDSNGNGGLTTTAPAAKLDIYATRSEKLALSDPVDSIGEDILIKHIAGGDNKFDVGFYNETVSFWGVTPEGENTALAIDENGTIGMLTNVMDETCVLEVNGHIRHTTDDQYDYWGGAKDAGRTFNGTDLIDDFDLLNAGNSDYRLQENGVDRFVVLTGEGPAVAIDDLGHVGIGTSVPLGTIHVKTGSSGTIPLGIADDIVIEGSDHTGMSLIAPNNKSCIFVFGNPDDNYAATFEWNAVTGLLYYGTAKTGAGLVLLSDNYVERIRITDTGFTGIGVTDADEKLEVNGNIRHTADDQFDYWGALSDAGRTFNGTDLIDDFDLLNSGTSDYRLQEDGSDRFVVFTGGNVFIPEKLGINTIVSTERLEIDGNIRHMADNDLHYWGASNDVSRTFNGTDLLDDYDTLNAGTVDYRLQEHTVDRLIVLAGGLVQVSNFVHALTPIYRRYYHFAVSGFSPGASGATWITSSVNLLCGWGLDAPGEEIEGGGVDVHSDWDEASDIDIELNFTTYADNSGGNVNDTVDIICDLYYKQNGATICKTQVLTDSVVVGQAALYTQFTAHFVFDYDPLGGDPVEVGDKICFVVHLDTAASEVDSIVVHGGSFNYQTTHIGIESGDT